VFLRVRRVGLLNEEIYFDRQGDHMRSMCASRFLFLVLVLLRRSDDLLCLFPRHFFVV
jgi:hypothetical protein